MRWERYHLERPTNKARCLLVMVISSELLVANIRYKTRLYIFHWQRLVNLGYIACWKEKSVEWFFNRQKLIKSKSYSNPTLKLMVNDCGHSLCNSCVQLLFSRGQAPCPQVSLLEFHKYPPNTDSTNARRNFLIIYCLSVT